MQSGKSSVAGSKASRPSRISSTKAHARASKQDTISGKQGTDPHACTSGAPPPHTSASHQQDTHQQQPCACPTRTRTAHPCSDSPPTARPQSSSPCPLPSHHTTVRQSLECTQHSTNASPQEISRHRTRAVVNGEARTHTHTRTRPESIHRLALARMSPSTPCGGPSSRLGHHSC